MRRLLTALAILIAASPAAAKTAQIDIQPIQIGNETGRYREGVASVDLLATNGAVRIGPLPRLDDNLRFAVTVYNNGDKPVDFDVGNVTATASGASVPAHTTERHAARERSKSLMGPVPIGLIGMAAWAASASKTSIDPSRPYTPHGGDTFIARYPNYAGQFQAYGVAHDTGWAISAIQQRLDMTTDAFSEEMVRRTTVDPGDSYSGFILLQSIPYRVPVIVDLTVDWNGEKYPFRFQVVKPGTPAPIFTNRTPPAFVLRQHIRVGTQLVAPNQVPAGAKLFNGGILIPAKTDLGWCIDAAPDYVGAGSETSPAITSAMPRCDGPVQMH